MTPPESTPRNTAAWLFVAVCTVLVLLVYGSGLNNALVFDDLRLEDGTIFGRYGSLMEFRQRLLSYGSFVWLHELLGLGWKGQRVVNLLLHLGVAAALWAFTRALLSPAAFDTEHRQQPQFAQSLQAAVLVGVALFALNPVAVYAVAYLVQRSILMATLFGVLACWAWVRGLQSGRWPWFAAALLAYAAAVLSKEHAAVFAAFAVPLYVHVRRPGWHQTALIVAGATVLLAAVAALFWGLYGQLVGQVFDPASQELVAQLEALRPGVAEQVYPLSVLNEAALFWAYGLRWLLPNVQWMSIDLRPAFPLGLSSMPQLVGALGYLALLAAALWAVLRKRGLWAVAGVLLLLPLLGYVTEFATVWVQDPFVLYRSYLWAIALPGLLALLLVGLAPRTLYTLGLVLAVGLATLGFERVQSFKNAGTVWADAAAKIRLDAPPQAVGRSRAFLNLGSHLQEQERLAEARRALQTAIDLGDTQGKAWFNIGTSWQQEAQHEQALNAFDAAEKQGYQGQSLHMSRAESAFALRRFESAFQDYDATLRGKSDLITGLERTTEQLLRLRRAESATATNRFDVAVADYEWLLQIAPDQPALQHGLAMALVGQGNSQRAIELFDQLLKRGPNPASFYGRALALHFAGQHEAALRDITQALRLQPNNPQYQAVYQQLKSAAAAPAPTVGPRPGFQPSQPASAGR